MEITRSAQGPIAILAVRGAIIEEEMEPLERHFREALAEGRQKMVIDMLEVPFIDSFGIERLHHMVTVLGEHGGNLCVAALNDVCRDIFLVTRMEAYVQTAQNRDLAARILV